MRKLTLAIISCFIAFELLAQADFKESAPFLYKRYWQAGAGLHNLGWQLHARTGFNKSVKHDFILEFDFVRGKHPKEIRISNPAFSNPRPYVYGKQNDLFFAHLGGGRTSLIFDKSPINGVEVRYLLSGGLSLALLKPIYLDILVPRNNAPDPTTFITVTEQYDPDRHFTSNIFGAAFFTQGLNQTNITPGIYGKLGLVFEWGYYAESIKTFEAGVMVDAFPQALPVMAFAENRSLFVSFFLNVQLGKRWKT